MTALIIIRNVTRGIFQSRLVEKFWLDSLAIFLLFLSHWLLLEWKACVSAVFFNTVCLWIGAM